MRILITCSGGGHLAQAWALESWWRQHERTWVTSPTEDTRARLQGEHVIECHYPTVRNLPNLVRNTALARGVLRELRPELIFSTGAAIAVPFFALAKRYGALTAHLEPVDRITGPSITGTLVYPFADQFFVQWEALHKALPESTYVGIVL